MNKYFEQNLKLVDYIDGMMIVDRDCIIRYYYTAYPEVGNLREQDVIGKSLRSEERRVGKECAA